jgi:hypothetical protein
MQAGRPRVRVPMRSLNCFKLPNSSSRTMALGLTQPLTEMSTRNHKMFLESRARPMRKADNFTVICEQIV